MRSKDLIANAKKANAAALAAAFQTGDETKMTEALAAFWGDVGIVRRIATSRPSRKPTNATRTLPSWPPVAFMCLPARK